jgi:hypothetical protein
MDIWSKKKRSAVMAKIKGKDTKPEWIVRRYLFSRGYRYRKNVKGLPGTPDIVLRNLQFLQKIEKSTSLTIFLLLFVLGISIGSNSLIINNLGRFGWQAAILATLSILGSMLASFLVFHLFFKKGGKQ